MKTLDRASVLAAVLLAGCGTTRNVAVTSFHVTRDVAVGSYRVATAPVHYALARHSNEPTMVGTTDAVASDVTQPGQQVTSTQVASARQQQSKRDLAKTRKRSGTPSHVAQAEPRGPEPQPPPIAPESAASSTFPTAKAVPGKPGYVFSPFDSSGRYVDVSGYTSGTKVKDPWTDKIFVVP
jgi:hypothetical protein